MNNCEQDEELRDELVDGCFNAGSRLPLSERRRYAKAKSIFEVGVWAVESMDLILGVDLTTKADYRNSWELLRRDNRRLRYELPGACGIEYEDCFCSELTPEGHEYMRRAGTVGMTVGNLFHLHGFMKLEKPIGAVDMHSILSPLWEKIHGSKVVWVQDLYNIEGIMAYNVKHAVKHYADLGSANRRLLKSDGWLPPGYRSVDKVLNKWALAHLYDWENVEDFAPGTEGMEHDEYIPYVWDIKREYLRKWCFGERVLLQFNHGYCLIEGTRIYDGSSCEEIGV